MVNVGRLAKPSDARSIQLGELLISYVPDGAVQLIPHRWLSGSTADDWIAHGEFLDGAGYLVAGIGGLLVERGDRALLIDAGYGPHQVPPHLTHPHLGALSGGSLMDGLTRLGRSPRDIEAVAFTHLHDDHIGWAVQPADAGQAPFGDARYLVSEPEWTFWRPRLSPAVTGALDPRTDLVGDGQEIFPGVTVLATPGHTPGHTSYVISSGGQRVIAFGDAMHSPIQVSHPRWSASADTDPTLGVRSRQRLLTELEIPNTRGFGGHFADVVFGQIAVKYGHRIWLPEPIGA